MPRLLVSLLALLVVLALGGAWWLLAAPDGVGERAARLARPGGASADAPDARPAPLESRAAPQPEQLAGGLPAPPPAAAPAAAAVAPLAPEGEVRGVLVDPDGAPLADEPVLLILDRDPWWHDIELAPDAAGLAEHSPLDATRSDAQGRFRLSARAGAVHRLRAGGAEAAPRELPGVMAGAELRVVLEPGLALEGVVVDAAGEPVAGAHVAALSAAQRLVARSDAEGRFRLAPLPAQPHFHGAWAPGHGVLSGVLVPGPEEQRWELPPPRDVRGQVLQRESNRPLAGARVWLTLDLEARLVGASDNEQPSRVLHEMHTTTDDEGRFVFADAPAAGIRVGAEAPGHVPHTMLGYEDRALRDDEEIVIALEELAPQVVHVIDGVDGRPVPDAEVAMLAPQGVVASARSDALGVAELELGDWDGLGPVRFTARDARGHTARGKRPRERDDPVELALVEPAVLDVLVTRDGAPVPDVEVAVISLAPTTLGRTGETGLAALTHERAGPGDEELVLQARVGDLQSVRTSVPWPLAEPGPVELALDDGAYLTGAVYDDLGLPVPSAHLWSSFGPGGHTDPEGRFRLGPHDEDATGRLFVDAEGYERLQLHDVWAGEQDLVLTLQPLHRWHGRVVDALSREPLEGFGGRLQHQVFADGAWVWRDHWIRVRPDHVEPGSFAVELPEAGRYRLRVTHPERLSATSLETDFDGLVEPPEVEVELAHAARLELLVEDAGGRAVPGLQVTVIDWAQYEKLLKPGGKGKQPPRRWRQRTDDEGRASFGLGEGGEFAVLMEHPERALGAPFFVWPGSPVQQEVSVGPTGDLIVAVRDEADRPVPNMRVTVRAVDGGDVARRVGRRTTETEVLFEVLPPGEYRVVVEARGFETQLRKVTVLGNLTKHTDIVLAKPDPNLPKGGPGGGRGGGGGGRGGR